MRQRFMRGIDWKSVGVPACNMACPFCQFLLLYAPDAASDSPHYRDDRVGTLRQLAVDPLFHGKGIGNALLCLAENWAFRRGYRWLALDTPRPAGHLIDYYQRQGFCIKETVQFAGRHYLSVVFSKSVVDRTTINRRPTPTWWKSVHRANPMRIATNGCTKPPCFARRARAQVHAHRERLHVADFSMRQGHASCNETDDLCPLVEFSPGYAATG